MLACLDWNRARQAVQRQVAYRSLLQGVLKTPEPVFWTISKVER